MVWHPSVNSIIQHLSTHLREPDDQFAPCYHTPRNLSHKPLIPSLPLGISLRKQSHHTVALVTDIFIPIVLKGAAVADGVRSLTHTRSHLGTIGILVDRVIRINKEGGKARGLFIECWLDIGYASPLPVGVRDYV